MKFFPGTIALFLSAFALAAGVDLPPERGIVLNLARGWQTAGGPQPGLVGSKAFHMEITPPSVKFTIPEPGARYNWRINLASTIDSTKFPIFTFTYRAKNLNTASPRYLVRLSDNPNTGGVQAIVLNQITADNQQHDLTVDLRKLKVQAPFAFIVLGVTADDNGEGSIEILGMRFEIPQDGQPVEVKKGADIVVTVTDPSDKPLAGATVTANPDRLNYAQNIKTNEAGQAVVAPISTDAKQLRIAVTADQMYPAELQFDADDSSPLSVKLFKSTTYSGTVTDEIGDGIENATVTIYIQPNGSLDRNYQRNWVITTDPQGHWVSPPVPDNGMIPYLQARHPDYAAEDFRQTIGLPKLRDGSAILILKKPKSLTGTVLGPDGNPVSGAKVMRGDRNRGDISSTTSDAQGHFTFEKLRLEPTQLVITSSKFAPEFAVGTPGKPVEIKLSAGNTIKGKVTDDAGKPVSGVRMVVAQWRGRGRWLDWSTQTNSQGEYSWSGAPADRVEFVFSKQGYRVAQATLIATEEKTITLKPSQKITGAVIDAATSQPVTNFKLIKGDEWNQNPNRRNWHTWEIKPFRNGKYQVSFDDDSNDVHVLRIEADGYQSAISRAIKPEENAATVDFQLKKAHPITATVHLPDGKPVAGAEVALLDGSGEMWLNNGTLERQGGMKAIQTDSAGRFSFPSPPGEFAVAVIADGGFLQVKDADLAKSETVTLRPWGKIEGLVKIGPTTAPAGTNVAGWSQNDNGPNQPASLRQQIEATTDATGHFIISKIVPGDYSIGRMVPLRGNSSGYTSTEFVHVDAGKTSTVTIGGIGRPVIGKIIIPDSVQAKINWDQCNNDIRAVQHFTQPKLPDDFDEWDNAKRQKWISDFYNSPEGKAFIAKQNNAYRNARNYTFHIERDNTFRVDDVSPGQYQADLYFYGPNYGSPIAGGTAKFTIPPMPNNRSDEPLTLPDMTIRDYSAGTSAVKTGQPFPDLPAITTTLDGSPSSLNSLKGKYILLDFRNSWYPGSSEIKQLKAIQERYASNGKFALVTIHLDDDLDACKERVRRNKLTWTQVQLPDATGVDYMSLGLSGSPDIFLLSPDGKLIARDLRGDAIIKAVSDALAAH